MQFLGLVNNKEYFCDESGLIHYRVPAEREAVRAGAGRKLVISDFSQIEVKIMTFLSQDPWLTNAINSGKDMHCYMSSCEDGVGQYPFDLLLAAKEDKLVVNYESKVVDGQAIDPELAKAFAAAGVFTLEELQDILAAERAGVKTVTFGVPYGAGVSKVAQMIRRKDKNKKYIETVEAAEARADALISRYFANAVMLKRWLENQGILALTYHFTRDPIGRIRFYPTPVEGTPRYKELVSQIQRWAGNHPIQTCCSSCLKKAVGSIYLKMRNGILNGPKIVDAYIMLVAHDEIVLNSAEACVEQTSQILKEAMEEAYNSVCLDFGGTVKYLSEIKNKVKVIVADYWAKD